MALIHRVSRLFKADFHAVLDQIEEPETLLKQSIREMEDDLAAAERRIRLCEHEQEALAARRFDLENALAETDAQLDLCFESGKDDLARKMVRKKLESARILQRLSATHATNEKYLAGQRQMLDENRSTLEGLRQKAEIFTQRGTARPGFDDIDWMAREMTVGDDEVEVAFLREKSLRGAS